MDRNNPPQQGPIAGPQGTPLSVIPNIAVAPLEPQLPLMSAPNPPPTRPLQPQLRPDQSKVPVYAWCSKCNQYVYTRVVFEIDKLTHIVVGLAFIVISFFACCLYNSTCLKRATHYCPNCGTYLGAYGKRQPAAQPQ